MRSSDLHDEAFLASVTAVMAGLHRTYYRRVPKHARTAMVGTDVLASVLGDGYAVVEQTIVDLERGRVGSEPRSAFQDAMEPRMVAAVKQLSGRDVALFVSKSRVDPAIEIELFALAPETAEPIVSLASTGGGLAPADIAEAQRRRLLAAARSLVEAVGQDEVTVDGITARARLPREVLYTHFPGLRACLDAALESS